MFVCIFNILFPVLTTYEEYFITFLNLSYKKKKKKITNYLKK